MFALASCRRSSAAPAVRAPDDSRHVVVISIDGLRPDHLRRPGLAIPTLRALMAAGVTADGVVSVWPSVTYPAHVTMVTGVSPAKHGVLTNKVFDPLGKTNDAWVWEASAIRARTLWDAAREGHVSTGASYWPVTVGASIDCLVPQIWRDRTDADDALMRKLTTPGLADELEKLGKLPAEHRTDRERARAAAHILRTRAPGLMLVYLTDLDTVQHKTGPMSPEADRTLERIDGDVASLVAAIDEAGARERTTFVVLSDHGFSPVSHAVRPNVALAKAGLLDVDGRGNVTGYRATAVTAGGLAGIVLARSDDAATIDTVTHLFEGLAKDPASGIARVYRNVEMTARGGFPDALLVLEAAERHTFVAGARGPLVSGTDYRGNHGGPPDRTELHASLILSGKGVRAGAKLGVVSLVDVAPTIARLLKLRMDATEGRVLEEALTP